jgi:hypothetical protein
MTYATNYATSVDLAFTGRVFMAIRDCGRDIINEDPGAANHTNRVLLAKIVVAHTTDWVPTFAARLAELGLTTASTDAELKTAGASVWDATVTESYWS